MGGRAFGMNRGVVRYVVDNCQDCIIDLALGKNDKNGLIPPIRVCNGHLVPESYSMVAHVPNAACVWFDRSGKFDYTNMLIYCV